MNRRCETLEPLHSAWVDGELRGRERARLGAHLQECSRCRASIAELRVTRTMLRSLPARNLVVNIESDAPASRGHRWPDGGTVRRVLSRTMVAVVLLVGSLGAAAFAAGSEQPADREVAVPVDVFVADHLVRAIGGPVSTPALLNAQRP